MKSSPVTLQSIARHLNISISTVSRALRGLPEISLETRQAVVDLATKWDYQPNQLASSLVNHRTRTIGVIVPNTGYPFFSAIIASMEEAAIREGYSLLLSQSNESYQRELVHIQNLLRSQVEGIIISLARDTIDAEHLHRLVRRQVPLVMFDRYAEGVPVPHVIVDNQLAARQAVQHLLANGCRRIAYLAGLPSLKISNERLLGYQDALAEAGISFDDTLVLHCDFTPDNAIRQTNLLLAMKRPPDGILAFSDRIAMASMYALRQQGIRIPDEMAIIGFNDEPTSSLLTPSLSSVAQPTYEMGQLTVSLLLTQIQAEQPIQNAVTHRLNTTLMVRESSGCPPVTG